MLPNARFRGRPIARALEVGADIVVTGRCVDSALVLGPLAHRFKWDFAKHFDALANGRWVNDCWETLLSNLQSLCPFNYELF
jgi:hypothetical protein